MSATGGQDFQANTKQMNAMAPQSFHINAASNYQYSPITRKDGPTLMPQAIRTAPRTSLFSKESREIAAVTPENEIEITADKKKTRQPKRSSSSKKMQSNNIWNNNSSSKASSLGKSVS